MATLAEALRRLESKQGPTRERGMKELLSLGEQLLALEHALKEDDFRVLDIVTEALYPEPRELLMHMFDIASSAGRASIARYHLTEGNYLHLEAEIAATFGKRARSMPMQAIEGLGLAYIRSMSDVFRKNLDATMENLEVARARIGPKAVGGVRRFVDQEERHTWSGASKRAVVSAIALRRLDAELDTGEIFRMLGEVPSAMGDCPEQRCTMAELDWILFDCGERSLDDVLEHDRALTGVLPDVATTLLKREEEEVLLSLADRFGDVYFTEPGFVYWPLIDVLVSRGVIGPERLTQSNHGYLRARRLGVEPPPWWQWLSPAT